MLFCLLLVENVILSGSGIHPKHYSPQTPKKYSSHQAPTFFPAPPILGVTSLEKPDYYFLSFHFPFSLLYLFFSVFVLFLFLFHTWKHNLVITSLKNSFLSSFLFTSLLPHFFITSFLVFFSSFMFISFLWFLNSALQNWSKANNANPDRECGHSWKCSVLWGVIGFQGLESTVNT